MPYQTPGLRYVVPGSPSHKACSHGQIVTENGLVGSAFKTKQATWNTLPAAADDIAVDEEFVLELMGIQEAPMTGDLADVALSGAKSEVYIRVADNVLFEGSTAATVFGTAPVLAAGILKVGKVVEIDTSRNPDVCRIHLGLAHLIRGNLP